MKAVLRASLLLAVIAAIVGGLVAYSIVRRGLSTRVPPSAMEATMALMMRSMATPAHVRSQRNPVPPMAPELAGALEHFADHCATCHGNDGSGDTEIGRNLYPPVPDMRAARTQDLTDGELFSIIENGIRLTGMPAWSTGTAEGERSSWALVHFIRRLPKLTPEEIVQMETLNPRSPEQFREEEEMRRFLAGEGPTSLPSPPASPSHKGPHN